MLPTIPLPYVSEWREGPPSGLGGTAFRERWEGDSVSQDVWHLWELNASSERPWCSVAGNPPASAGTWVQSLVREHPTCSRASGPVHHDC